MDRERRRRAEQLLEKAADLQSAFWEAISDLERELGCEVDSTGDLQNVAVEDLLR